MNKDYYKKISEELNIPISHVKAMVESQFAYMLDEIKDNDQKLRFYIKKFGDFTFKYNSEEAYHNSVDRINKIKKKTKDAIEQGLYTSNRKD
jgi:nucleoid DNA-binding protein